MGLGAVRHALHQLVVELPGLQGVAGRKVDATQRHLDLDPLREHALDALHLGDRLGKVARAAVVERQLHVGECVVLGQVLSVVVLEHLRVPAAVLREQAAVLIGLVEGLVRGLGIHAGAERIAHDLLHDALLPEQAPVAEVVRDGHGEVRRLHPPRVAFRLLEDVTHHELVRVRDVALVVLERTGAEHVDRAVIEMDRHLGLFVAQLADVPVRVEQRQIHDPDVLAEALDLLDVPERERVVVTVREHERVRLQGREHVVGVVARDVVAAAVVRVPVIREQQERLGREQPRRGHRAPTLRIRVLERLPHPLHEPSDAQPDPDRVGVEPALEEVVAVTHFLRREVQEHDHACRRQPEERERVEE